MNREPREILRQKVHSSFRQFSSLACSLACLRIWRISRFESFVTPFRGKPGYSVQGDAFSHVSGEIQVLSVELGGFGLFEASFAHDFELERGLDRGLPA